MAEISCDVLVIGSGPGGYAAGIRAGQLGLDTIVVEAEEPGGTCLNVGCIPSKALLHVAERYAAVTRAACSSDLGIHLERPGLDLNETMLWKDSVIDRLKSGVSGLLRKAGVRTVNGWARMIDGKTAVIKSDESGIGAVRARHVVLATGSRPVAIEGLPFGEVVISSSEALSLTQVPSNFVVIGGGYIGLEIGTAYAKLGSSVTVIEARDSVLPAFDDELVRPIRASLDRLGMTVLTSATATGISSHGAVLSVRKSSGESVELRPEKILVAVGRAPLTDGWGLEELDLARSGPFIKVDGHCRTSMAGVYAVGDVTGEPMLAHRAIAQGEMVAEIIAGKRRTWDAEAIPAVVFTDPEIVTVGLTPNDAKQKGIRTIEGQFPLSANGRAISTDDDTGFVRIVARAEDHAVVGVQGVGADISELSAVFTLAIEMGACIEDLAGTIHAHPTRSEALHEAASRMLGAAIHV